MLTLTGTPVVYYGDEFGKLNDEQYYKEQIKLTGKNDTRFLVRGRIDWRKLEKELLNKEGFHSKVYEMIVNLLSARKSLKAFGRGSTNFLKSSKQILAYTREFAEEKALVVNNLSSADHVFNHPLPDQDLIILHAEGFTMDDSRHLMKFEPHGFAWFAVV
jgi:maltose alpha-D-glucosyltransferase/alpha-amylase